MPTYDEVMGELARQGLGDLDPYGGAAAGPMGALADQSAYNPWERAAAAVRFGAKPLGGRQEGVATTLPQELLAAPVRAAAGFTKAAFDRAAEEHPLQAMTPPPVARRMGGPSSEPLPMQTSTDYDSRRMGAFLGAETAFNTTGFGSPFSQAGALGSAGGKAVMGQLAEQAPPFYSAVERAVQGAKQNVAPGQQWAGYLRNQPGVKPEEIEALKLGQLFEQPGALPKQAVLDQIVANRVNVGEVTKGGSALAAQEQQELNTLRQRMNTQELTAPEYRRIEDLEHREAYGMNNTTKFQQYTLPGGENYREMLLTLPESKGTGFDPSKVKIERNQSSTTQGSSVLSYDGRNIGTYADDPRLNPQTGQYQQQPDAYWIDVVRRRYSGDPQRGLKAMDEGKNFRSSHYNEPNILAHVRYNDRVIDGKKTLFVEEVQSDWHQAGRTRGYGTTEEPGKVVPQEGNLWRVEWLDGTYSGGYHSEAAAREAAARRTASKGAVPDAPFKTTWPELAMKRIIREAAEKGYDKVAWTPGSVQAARYDLSKQVNGIRWEPSIAAEGHSVVRIDPRDGATISIQVDKNGNVVGSQRGGQFEGRNLSDVVGKEIAEKIVGKESGFLKDLDLQVGGEGMKGFYDEILPSTVNKLVKKHGGRVQQGNIAKPPEMDFDALRRDPSGRPAMKFENQTVHTIDITPSLREQAMKGFPLFTAGGIAATGVMGELARQDKYQQ